MSGPNQYHHIQPEENDEERAKALVSLILGSFSIWWGASSPSPSSPGNITVIVAGALLMLYCLYHLWKGQPSLDSDTPPYCPACP